MGQAIQEPHDETMRLQALQRLGILDTPETESFDRLTALAASLFSAPIALVSLLDAERQWFKSRHGFELRETPRTWAFCAHTILQRDIFMIADTTNDSRFAANPLVVGPPHVRTYVGAPLVTPDGHTLGALCLWFDEATSFNTDQQQQLAQFAQVVVGEIERWQSDLSLKETSAQLAAVQESEAQTRRRLQESEERLRLATEASGIGIWDWDIASDRVSDTDTLLRQLGYDPAQLPEDFRPHEVLIHPDDKASADAAMRDYLMRVIPEYRCEFRLRARDGSYRWILAQGRVTERTQRDMPRRFVGTHMDVTPLVEIKEEMARTAKEAQAANRAKSDLLANMSHELRTPLNGVLGMAQVLLTDETLGPVQKDYLNVIKDSGRTLLTLVNDILDISLIETGGLKLEHQPLDLIDMMNRASALWRPIAAAKGLALTLDLAGITQPLVTGDEERIRQVLMNIVSNAIKFTLRGSITVAVSQDDGADGRIDCTFSVTDTGIGVAPEDQERLFRKFEQVDMSHTRSFGGSGLGLAIAKGIVEALEGDIGLDSEVGRGSTFWFTLPLPLAEEEDDPVIHADNLPDTSRQNRNLRILVAEDAPDNLAVVRAVLYAIYGKGRVDITAVSTGIEAVGAVIDEEYDLVLMDVRMPGMDGLEATRRIRALAGAKSRIPIIAITAHAMKGDKEKYLRGGMTDYIAKPIDAKILIEKIETHTLKVARPDTPKAD